MTAEIMTYEGKRYRLPELLSWRLEYACGVPCDSFQVECLFRTEDERAYQKAVRFFAYEGGQTVFTGVVDEVEWTHGPEGRRVTVAGRSLAALLLDNEAEAADYGAATLGDILRDHVTPYGIQVGERVPIPPCQNFSVASGQSEWQALYQFCRYHGGVPPRFDREGRLILAPFRDGTEKVLGPKVPVTKLTRTERRYGVLSEVLVRDKSRKTTERVENPAFLAEGGQCRRVVSTGGKSSTQAMRYSGKFQLDKAWGNRRSLTMTVPLLFFAWPGELIRMERIGWTGTWRVLESVVTLDEGGSGTTLTLGMPDTVI